MWTTKMYLLVFIVSIQRSSVCYRRLKSLGGQKLILRRILPSSCSSEGSASDIWVRWWCWCQCGPTNDDVDMTIMLRRDCIANNDNNETYDDILGAPLGAEDCLRQVIANAPKLQVDGSVTNVFNIFGKCQFIHVQIFTDHHQFNLKLCGNDCEHDGRYLAPYATVELALILINSGQIDEAGLLLETAKYVHDDDDDDDHYHDLGDYYGNHKWWSYESGWSLLWDRKATIWYIWTFASKSLCR